MVIPPPFIGKIRTLIGPRGLFITWGLLPEEPSRSSRPFPINSGRRISWWLRKAHFGEQEAHSKMGLVRKHARPISRTYQLPLVLVVG